MIIIKTKCAYIVHEYIFVNICIIKTKSHFVIKVSIYKCFITDYFQDNKILKGTKQ